MTGSYAKRVPLRKAAFHCVSPFFFVYLRVMFLRKRITPRDISELFVKALPPKKEKAPLRAGPAFIDSLVYGEFTAIFYFALSTPL